VSFRSYDAKGTSNYENGLIPNHFYDEYMDEQSLRWIEWGELGDASEPMLRIALDKIDGVTTTLSATRLSKIDVGAVACPNVLQYNSLRGTIVAPTDNFYTE
jgi:hypothetical protein